MTGWQWIRSHSHAFLRTLCTIVAIVLYMFMNSVSALGTPEAITVFTARKVITMDPAKPYASAIAVKDGRILSVGSLRDMQEWLKPGTYHIDNRFHDEVITPGMIEAHSHITMMALFLHHPYVGYHNTLGFNAHPIAGLKSKKAVIEKLKQLANAEPSEEEVLFAWGYDPIFFQDAELSRNDLDTISSTRPVFVLNASGHIAYVNSVLLKKLNYNKSTVIPGVMKDKNSEPTGVLKEEQALKPAFKLILPSIISPIAIEFGLKGTATLANNVGLTTISDMLFGGPGEEIFINEFKKASIDRDFPVRMAIVYDGSVLADMNERRKQSGVNHFKKLQSLNNDKLIFTGAKFIIDGSIQGFTALIKWPGYFNGAKNTLTNTTVEKLKKETLPLWAASIPLHIHANGNQATDEALNTLEYLQNTTPRKGALFVIEHNQLSSEEQFVRAEKLGAYTNLFPNQIYYWGDQHYAITLGPDRANSLDNAKEAQIAGVRFSLHTDAPVTPLGPLHSMWAAVNRTTASGRVLGKHNKITPEDALRAVTIDAAYMHNLQNEIGSIEIGKRADFTVLEYDPLTVNPYTIKDIPVIATVINGVVYPSRTRSRY